MTDREKRFHVKVMLARGLGAAIGVGAAAAVLNVITLPAFVLLSIALGAAGAAAGSMLGDYFGYLLDDTWLSRHAGPSLLFNTVVSAVLGSLLFFLALDFFAQARTEPVVPLLAISAFSGFVASTSARLLETIYSPRMPRV